MESSERIITKGGVKYKLIAPEGGWGYMICLAIAAQFIILFAPVSSFGLIYNNFLNELGEGTSGVTLVLGTYTISISISGFMTNVLLKRMTLRKVSLLGSSIYSVGNMLAIFVTSISHVAITNGLLVGFGSGLAFPVCYTCFNTYFTQSRLAYLSAIKVVVGLGTMLVPLLLRYFLDEFGFRGTLALVFAMGLHSFLASVILQPVEWHLKMEEILPDAEDTPLNTSQNDDKCLEVPKNNEEIKSNSKPTEVLQFTKVDDTTVANGYTVKVKDNIINNLEKNDTDKSVKESFIIHMPNNKEKFTLEIDKERLDIENEPYVNVLRRCSIMSLGDFAHAPVENLPSIMNNGGRMKFIVDYLDLSLFKDMVYTNICLGMSVASFSDFTFFMLLPLSLFNIGWDNDLVARGLAVAAGGELAGKLTLAIASKLKDFKSRYIYLTGMLFSLCFRYVFVMLSGKIAMLVLIGAMGSVRCLMHGTTPLLFAEHVPIERFPAAYGLHLLFFGIMNLLMGPVVGFIRDVSGSYPLVFHLLTSLLVIVAVSWTIELYYRRKHEQKSFTDNKISKDGK